MPEELKPQDCDASKMFVQILLNKLKSREIPLNQLRAYIKNNHSPKISFLINQKNCPPKVARQVKVECNQLYIPY